MKRDLRVLGFTLLLIATAGLLPVYAQRGGMMMGKYDPKAEITVQGTVDKVEQMNDMSMPGMNMQGAGLHLLLKTGKETVDVHLGPAAFVEKTMKFKEGDSIQVVGAKVTMMDKPALIAREVKKGDETLKLRDAQGKPLWSQGMQRNPSFR
jgi:DNA/RNA endonuclease YhcR with UshA esterase domain